MAENYMGIVAKLLGVELNEEFGVAGLSFKYKLKKDGLIFWSEDSQEWIGSNLIEDLLSGKARVVKLPKQILTDSEKGYLSNVIEPFRDRVMYVIKSKGSTGEFITIHLNHYNGWLSDLITLPVFEKGAMYKGIEIDKRYTLDELGL